MFKNRGQIVSFRLKHCPVWNQKYFADFKNILQKLKPLLLFLYIIEICKNKKLEAYDVYMSQNLC